MDSYELRDRRPSATPAHRAGPATYELGEAPDYKEPISSVTDVKYAGGPGGERPTDADGPVPVVGQVGEVNELKRNLHGRHMQMIAIGEFYFF